MASEKKKAPAAVKPAPKPPTIHNHYGADRHLLNILLWALITVVLYFAFTAFLQSPVVLPDKESSYKVRIIGGGQVKETVVPSNEAPAPREAPEPRVQ